MFLLHYLVCPKAGLSFLWVSELSGLWMGDCVTLIDEGAVHSDVSSGRGSGTDWLGDWANH